MLRDKLLSGKLKKHSEQLNKFVAGFFDADGCVTLSRHHEGYLQITSKITQAASKDPDFEVMRSLMSHYGIGRLYFSLPAKGASYSDWQMTKADSKIFFNRIGKHLLIKKRTFEDALYFVEELKGVKLTKEAFDEIQEYISCTRGGDMPLARVPKHLSWAYTAGILAGDGHFRCALGRKYKGWLRNELTVELSNNSKAIMDVMKSSFRGNYRLKDTNCYKWCRGMGVGSRGYSVRFLSKIKRYMLLDPKLDTINRMLQFHKELPAETKQSPPEKEK